MNLRRVFVGRTDKLGKWNTAIATMAVLFGCAACGGIAPETGVTFTEQQVASLTSITTPFNSAMGKLEKVDTSQLTTTAQLQAAFAPVIDAAKTSNAALLRMGLTGKAATDVHKFVSADSAVASDLRTTTISDWTSKKVVLAHDETTAESADNVLREYFGLLPVRY